MNQTLRNFYTNESERKAVQAYLIETLSEMAVEKAFNGESVSGIKDAKEMVEKMFEKLEVEYGTVKEPINNNSR